MTIINWFSFSFSYSYIYVSELTFDSDGNARDAMMIASIIDGNAMDAMMIVTII